ncbi:MAG: hypothetical protein ACYC3G_03185 [Minisyncoccota bacterium]
MLIIKRTFLYILVSVFFIGLSVNAAGFEIGTTEIDNYKKKYSDEKIKILIVPGHDKEFFGTQFKTIKEEVFNLQLATDLYNFFKNDPHFEAYIARDTKGYLPVFKNYFTNKKDAIEKFVSLSNDWFGEIFPDFQWIDGVDHNTAKQEVALRLFGINAWANENNIDLIIHVHFNDYAGRKKNVAGDYSGFCIYIPERQLNNYFFSSEIANSIFPNLKKVLPVSDITKEDKGIVEDQQLIAIGPKNTLFSPSMLIEYSYIYDSYALNSSIRKLFFKELAYSTYTGVKKYFDPTVDVSGSTILPYKWGRGLVYGLKNNKDVLSLQLALLKDGVYPPSGYSLKDCPITGNFLKCTKLAVNEFQEKYKEDILKPIGYSIPTGKVGAMTVKKLNSLFSK